MSSQSPSTALKAMGICWEDENKRLGVDFHKCISQSTWVVSNWNWPQLKKNSKDIQKKLAKFKQSFRSWRESWRYSSWEKITPELQNRSGRMVVGILLRSEPFTTMCFGTKIILSKKPFYLYKIPKSITEMIWEVRCHPQTVCHSKELLSTILAVFSF